MGLIPQTRLNAALNDTRRRGLTNQTEMSSTTAYNVGDYRQAATCSIGVVRQLRTNHWSSKIFCMCDERTKLTLLFSFLTICYRKFATHYRWVHQRYTFETCNVKSKQQRQSNQYIVMRKSIRIRFRITFSFSHFGSL